MKPARRIALAICIVTLAGCGKSGPGLTVTDVQIVAPAPGRAASVAYLTIHNDGDPAILTTVSSPFFARAELHETRLTEGVARMQRVTSVDIATGEAMRFEPGGKHIMLFDPASAPLPGKNVALHLEFASGEMLIVDAPLATRVDVR